LILQLPISYSSLPWPSASATANPLNDTPQDRSKSTCTQPPDGSCHERVFRPKDVSVILPAVSRTIPLPAKARQQSPARLASNRAMTPPKNLPERKPNWLSPVLNSLMNHASWIKTTISPMAPAMPKVMFQNVYDLRTSLLRATEPMRMYRSFSP